MKNKTKALCIFIGGLFISVFLFYLILTKPDNEIEHIITLAGLVGFVIIGYEYLNDHYEE